jgi:hypothetical protein
LVVVFGWRLFFIGFASFADSRFDACEIVRWDFAASDVKKIITWAGTFDTWVVYWF